MDEDRVTSPGADGPARQDLRKEAMIESLALTNGTIAAATGLYATTGSIGLTLLGCVASATTVTTFFLRHSARSRSAWSSRSNPRR